MCGIAGILIKSTFSQNFSNHLNLLSKLLKHRGPDGEGFMVVQGNSIKPYSGIHPFHPGTDALPYFPEQNLPEYIQDAQLGFVHRRLSIIDLSENGHQPMCDFEKKIWITYNGELYNYLELREELKKSGHRFISESDTEVIIHAYKEWGTDCVNRFNGMWSFCIYDAVKGLCFASRDRLGVKPFYYTNHHGYFAFASEQKALVKSGLASPEADEESLHNYLTNGLLENTTKNFFRDIQELWPGTNLIYDLKTQQHSLQEYYHLKANINSHNDLLADKELIQKIKEVLIRSVQLRLRSDVAVGTCLSGGIDSSALAVCISELTHRPFYCFTSVFPHQKFNEEHFAETVALKTGAFHAKVEPTLEGLKSELDTLIYSQDIPIWDTSTYAQYKVMELAKQNSIKVVLDGQGADELFGGYHHHYLATWNHYFSKGQYLEAFKNILASNKSINHPLLFFMKEKVKQNLHFRKNDLSRFFREDFIKSYPLVNPSSSYNDLNEQLLNDIYHTRLKSFLKCEDRCGMWHSVESRVPFSDDIDLINLMFSFDGNRKIKNGISKYLLREAMKELLPEQIYNRYDKKGFETPMEQWLIQLQPEMIEEILDSGLGFIKSDQIKSQKTSGLYTNKLLFKLYIYCRWKNIFTSSSVSL